MKVYGIVDWIVVRGVSSGVGRGFDKEINSGIYDEVGEVVELEVGGKVVSRKISNMKSMLKLVKVYIENLI